jgi:YVTN family beta-propeller protein
VIAVLDPATGGVTAKIPGVMTVGVFSPDSQRLYGVGLDGIAVIDTATDVPTTAVANIPYAADLAITPDGKHLYITDHSTNSVLVADSATYTISTILPISIAGIGAIAIVSAH